MTQLGMLSAANTAFVDGVGEAVRATNQVLLGNITAEQLATDTMKLIEGANGPYGFVLPLRPEEKEGILVHARTVDAFLNANTNVDNLPPLTSLPLLSKLNLPVRGLMDLKGGEVSLKKALLAQEDSEIVAALREMRGVPVGTTNAPLKATAHTVPRHGPYSPYGPT